METFDYKEYKVRMSFINGTSCYIVDGYSHIFTTLKMTKDFIKWLIQQKYLNTHFSAQKGAS